MNDLGAALASLGVGFWIFVSFVLIIWFLLPFAVFGIKRRLDKLIVEQEQTNKLLKRLLVFVDNKGSPEP